MIYSSLDFQLFIKIDDFNEIVESKSIEIAEFSKLLENIYRSVNIGFIVINNVSI